MDTTQIHAGLTVDEVLENWPETAQVFVRNHTECIGCYAVRFCTLADVARDYALDLETLLKELRSASNSQIIHSRSKA